MAYPAVGVGQRISSCCFGQPERSKQRKRYYFGKSFPWYPEPGPDLLATVEVSGSTNSLPYRIMILTDGSATMSIKGGSTKNFKPGSVDAKTLKTLLQNVGDVSQLTSQPCAKPVSFATVTLITYNGKTSQDISCAGTHWPQAGCDLRDFIDRIKLSLPVGGSA